ncbi:MAG: hypothetical protein WCR42_01040 [bacterium]
MKIFFTLLAFFAISTSAIAQQNLQDVLYLKNGCIIHGTIIEQIPYQTIKLETVYHDVFVYQMDEIERITKEPLIISNEIEPSFEGLKLGYQGTIEAGLDIGEIDLLKVNIINAYRFNPYYSIGIGIGLRLGDGRYPISVPVFFDFRTNLLNKKVSPYLALALGYSLDLEENLEGQGLFINPTVGISFKISRKSFLNIGMGFEDIRFDYIRDNYYTYGDAYEIISRNFNFNIGVTF